MAASVAEKGRMAAGKAPRADKAEAVEALRNHFDETTSLVLFDYRGLSVSQMTALRKRTREAGVRLSVVKNTLAERAIEGTGFGELRGKFVGPLSIATTDGDPSTPAKILKEFTKKESAGEIRGGVLDGRFLETAEVETLADLPLARGAALAAAGRPAGARGGPARVLNGVLAQFVNVLDAVAKKREEAL